MVQIIDTLGQQRQAMAEALALLQRRQAMNEQSRQFQIEQQRAMDEAAQRERMQQQALDTSSQNTIAGKMPQAEFLSWYQRQSPEVKARYGNIDPSMFPNAQMEQTTTGQRLGIDNKLMNGEPLPFQAAGNPALAKLPVGQQLERSQGGFLGYGGAPAATAMRPSSSIAYTTPSKQQLAVDASTGAAPTAGEQLSASTQRRGQDMQYDLGRKQIDASQGGIVDQGTMLLVEQVKKNPDVYYSLGTKERDRVANGLAQQGIMVPRQLGQNEQTRLDTAYQGINNIDTIKSIVDKWDQRGIPISGPLLGRFSEAEQKWGMPISQNIKNTMIGQNVPPQYQNEWNSDAASIRLLLKYLVTQEAAATGGGGRVAYQLIRNFETVSASPSKGGAILTGTLNQMRDHMGNVAGTIKSRQLGENPIESERGGGNGGGQVPVGTTKTFPNGRIGRWDGQGWEMVQ